MKGQTRALTVSAFCAALSTVILALGQLLPAQRLALLCVSSLGVVVSLCTNGRRWALCSYAVSAALGLLLLPEKSMPLAYALFCGYYPILKLKLEELKSAPLRYSLKLLCFNLTFAAYYFLAKLVAELPLWLLSLGANGAFLVYDYALGKLILLYSRKIAGRIDHG